MKAYGLIAAKLEDGKHPGRYGMVFMHKHGEWQWHEDPLLPQHGIWKTERAAWSWLSQYYLERAEDARKYAEWADAYSSELAANALEVYKSEPHA